MEGWGKSRWQGGGRERREADEICTFHAFFFSPLSFPFLSFFSFFNSTLFPALNRGVYTLRYNRICTGGYLLSMGVSITSTRHKLRHPYRVNTFEFISAVPRLCPIYAYAFSPTPIYIYIYLHIRVIYIYSACRFNIFGPINEPNISNGANSMDRKIRFSDLSSGESPRKNARWRIERGRAIP